MPTDEMLNSRSEYLMDKRKRRTLAMAPPAAVDPVQNTQAGAFASMGDRAMLDRNMDQESTQPVRQGIPDVAPLDVRSGAPDQYELERMRYEARKRMIQLDGAARVARARAYAQNDRFTDPTVRAANWSALREAELESNRAAGDMNRVGDVGRTFMSPEQLAAKQGELRTQMASNTGGTGGRVPVQMDPKANAAAFFLDNGADRYQGATETFTRLNRANMNRQAMNAEQNAPRDLAFDNSGRAAEIAGRAGYEQSPMFQEALMRMRQRKALEDRAVEAGTKAATINLETGVAKANADLGEQSLRGAMAGRGVQAASDNEMYGAARSAGLAGETEKEARARLGTAKAIAERARIESGTPGIEERTDALSSGKALRDAVRADALDREGITDISKFLDDAATYASNLGGAVGFSGLGVNDAQAQSGIDAFNTTVLSKIERLAKVPELAPIISDWAARIAPVIESNLPESGDQSALGTATELTALGNPITSSVAAVRRIFRAAQGVVNSTQGERISKIRALSERARRLTTAQ